MCLFISEKEGIPGYFDPVNIGKDALAVYLCEGVCAMKVVSVDPDTNVLISVKLALGNEFGFKTK